MEFETGPHNQFTVYFFHNKFSEHQYISAMRWDPSTNWVTDTFSHQCNLDLSA